MYSMETKRPPVAVERRGKRRRMRRRERKRERREINTINGIKLDNI